MTAARRPGVPDVALLAVCFPLLMGAFLLVMERLEVLLLPIRTAAAAPPEVPPADGGLPAPRPPASSDVDADPLAA